MKYKIICDSSSDLNKDYLKNEYNNIEIGFDVVPFIINVDTKDYVDNGSINSEEMLSKLNVKSNTLTSCPSPFSYEDKCDAENNFIVTISSKLSGSYNSAHAAASEIEGNVFVIDSKGTGGVEQLIVDKLYELISSGLEFEDIKEKISEYRDELELYCSLSSFDNLIRKGRIKAGLAKIISMLKINLLCKGIEGELSLFKKCLNFRQSLSHMIMAIKARRENHKKCVITYTDNYDDAVMMKDKIEKLNLFEKITIIEAKALNSFYALRKGLIVSF